MSGPLHLLILSYHIVHKGLYSQSNGFSSSCVRMWEQDNKKGWVLKNWCLLAVVLEKTLESPLDQTRRSNQSIPKEINPEYSLEGLMLKLKLQYFGHLMLRSDSLEKTVVLGKTESKRGGWQRMRWLEMASLTQWTWVWVSPRSWWWMGKPGVLKSTGSQKAGHDWAAEQ